MNFSFIEFDLMAGRWERCKKKTNLGRARALGRRYVASASSARWNLPSMASASG